MRKSVFFSIALSISVLCFGAFAANERGRARTQNTTNQNTANAPVAARAATRGAVKTAATQNVGGNVSARAATKQTNAGSGVVSARAGSVQKVINTGTKVASATANTNVPQECQEGFFGCMDAFCMLDNASGGRCQCSDRIVELDKALEDILKLDEQTYLMATEGVERIQMGEGEEQIMARAKAVAEKTVNQDKEDNKKKVRTLDLSAWDNNIFNDVDDLFESNSGDSLETFADKQGDDLYKASAKMCAAQTSDKCKEYGSMMQLIYAQRIKSDCIAYENSLKAQKSQSQQKLQAAQKALREAALEEYQNQNKYATTGECVVAFTRCMQTTAECGEDYTGCVTLAAKENVKGNTSGKIAKQTTIKSSVAGADITLAATTMEQLLAKKLICESVTKQCVNSNKNDAVWKAFLRNAAPALKSAEDIAEQRLRMECIPSVAKCFQDACKSNFGDGDSYDMCLSNPLTYKSLCKVQLEPCLKATGGTYEEPEESTLWNGLIAMLTSMKVDTCTKEVKDCLLSDDRCGADYSNCIGLSTDAIMNLCPTEKLTACMGATEDGVTLTGADDVRDYVAQIAQGIALQVDNNMILACQNALDKAMENYCGDKTTCPKATILSNALTDLLRVQLCTEDGKECHDDVSAFSRDKVVTGKVMAMVSNKPDLANITYSLDSLSETNKDLFSLPKANYEASATTKKVQDMLNAAWKSKVSQIESDPKVAACLTGRDFEKFVGSTVKKSLQPSSKSQTPRYPNLTDSVKMNIADDLMTRLWTEYGEAIQKLNKEQVPALAEKLAARVEKEVGNEDAGLDASNKIKCLQYQDGSQKKLEHSCQRYYVELTANYDENTNRCTVKRTYFERTARCHCGASCKYYQDAAGIADNNRVKEKNRLKDDKSCTKIIQMPTVAEPNPAGYDPDADATISCIAGA